MVVFTFSRRLVGIPSSLVRRGAGKRIALSGQAAPREVRDAPPKPPGPPPKEGGGAGRTAGLAALALGGAAMVYANFFAPAKGTGSGMYALPTSPALVNAELERLEMRLLMAAKRR